MEIGYRAKWAAKTPFVVCGWKLGVAYPFPRVPFYPFYILAFIHSFLFKRHSERGHWKSLHRASAPAVVVLARPVVSDVRVALHRASQPRSIQNCLICIACRNYTVFMNDCHSNSPPRECATSFTELFVAKLWGNTATLIIDHYLINFSITHFF